MENTRTIFKAKSGLSILTGFLLVGLGHGQAGLGLGLRTVSPLRDVQTARYEIWPIA